MLGNTNVLLIEDNEGDYILTKELLAQRADHRYAVNWISSPEQGLDALVEDTHDICLVDYRLGAVSGIEIVEEARKNGSQTPIIVLTGEHSENVDAEAMAAGAQDYLVKGQLTADQLARAIRYGMKQKHVEKRLVEMAHHDFLTGLANRSLFSERFKIAVAQTRRDGRILAVLLLDLDRFKEINDTLGHPAGDALLQGVSERLRECVRETDTVARLRGDEFAIIATNMEIQRGATKIAKKIIAELSKPFQLNGRDVFVGVSIGIGVLETDKMDAEQLLKNADVALYQAKTVSGCAFRYFDEAMNARELAFKNMECEIRSALNNDQFELHYQPKWDLNSGQLAVVEALLRWQHPERGMIPPSEVIPIAEASGLIQPLGAWVLRQACQQIRIWQDAGLPGIPTAVNTSALQFKREGLYKAVNETIENAGIAPALLELEITESVPMEQSGIAIDVIRRLSERGIRITIDDFGTEYATFRLLTEVPVHGIKVDRSFVNKVLDDPKHAAIVKTIIAMAGHLNLSVVAEGVETEFEYEFLRQQGCQEVQGWFISPALPADQFVDWYHQTRPTAVIAQAPVQMPSMVQ